MDLFKLWNKYSMNLMYKNNYSRFLYCIVTSKGSGQIHTCHISHCEIKSHRIWPVWRAVPIKNSDHRIFRPFCNRFLWRNKHKSHTVVVVTQWFFYLRIPSPSHFCFGTHILNLSESQDSQSYSGKFCNGRNDFLVGLTLYSPSESWNA